MDFQYLPHINSPADLRKLPLSALPTVCAELRDDIISELSVNPGHLASSLGTVEMTVALHYVFNTPYDRLVWDVGHQAYGHKILTGRRSLFRTNRKFGGLRPFPSPEESEYDTFACGHAGNSISAALGMSLATVLKGEEKRQVVAIIGDGSMSCGLAFEGLNNAASTPNNLLIVLNDNDMSIDRSVGGLKEYLLRFHTSGWYNRMRFRLSQFMTRKGLLTQERRGVILRFNNALKSLLMGGNSLFEGLSIRYFGPYDGHDVEGLVRVLRTIKTMHGPKLLHIHTVKGKGYKPAEENQTEWHAPGRFDKEKGIRIAPREEGKPLKFNEVFGETLLELARSNERIIGVTPAMPTGCSMTILMKEMPTRAYDVGIAEGHALTFSGGMAKEGMHPFCNIYSAFFQRAYDNLVNDCAMLRLPVVLCLDRAGLVGEDGATHHGTLDMAVLRPVPNLTIASPLDEHELRRLMYTAQLPDQGTWAIRYPRGAGRQVDWRCLLEAVPVGRGRKLREGTEVAVLSIGPIGMNVADAIDLLSGTISVAHYDMRFLKPLDQSIIDEVATRFDRIISVEDGVRNGGLGTAIIEALTGKQKPGTKIVKLGLPDRFVEHGTVAELQRLCGLNAESIAQTIREVTRTSEA